MLDFKHLTSLKEINREEIVEILDLAKALEDVCSGRKESSILKNKVMATFFFEPSTRTRFSFETAMLRLGGMVITMADAMRTSSIWKGEDLDDTIRTIENYADVIILRHPEAGAADMAAGISRVPIINAGDGTNEHPTQALLDLFTIEKEQGRIDGLKITIVGDLKHTRSTNSLTLGLSNFDVELTLVSPIGFETNELILEIIKQRGISFRQTHELLDAIPDTNVIYVCRIQKERLANQKEYDAIKGSYVVNRKILETVPKKITVLHHLPRVDELSRDVDEYPGAAYFRQPLNGVLVRAAVLTLLLNRTSSSDG